MIARLQEGLCLPDRAAPNLARRELILAGTSDEGVLVTQCPKQTCAGPWSVGRESPRRQ